MTMNPLLIISAALLAVCTTAVSAAPARGERYLVDGRCVTIARADAEQVWYEWREGNASGSGSMGTDSLGERCSGGSAEQAAPAKPLRPPSNNAPAPAAGPAGDAAFAQQTLAAHNRLRCLHGVPPLQWRADVAAYAQRWVERGGFKHSDSYHSPLGPMGENLYGSSRTPSGADAAADWYSESKGYNYAREGSPGSGHFTAMIWKDAKYLGCGRAGGTVSCNYAPATTAMDCAVPNMGGCYKKQVMPVTKDASACP